MEPKYYGAAAEYNKGASNPFFSRRVLFIALGVLGLIALLVVGSMIFGAITSGPSRNLSFLVAREQVLQSTLEKNKSKVRSADLAKVVSEANLLTLTDTVKLVSELRRVYSVTTIATDVTSAEADTTTEAELKEATAIGNFDSTYADILREKVASSLELAQKVLAETSSQGLKDVLNQNITNLKAIDTELASLTL